MLWVDKYRPSKIEDLTYHEDLSQRLDSLAAHPESMPHLFFYGPPGAGKKTRIAAMLRQLYGNGATKLKLDKRVFTTPTKRQVEINMVTSSFHIELSPGDAGLNDRYVVQDVIKEMASNKNIAAAAISNGKAEFKTVVLLEVDRLSRQAQAALRRTMEKYASTCRLILCCNSQSKVIEPVRSRCLGIRVAAPTENEVSFQVQTAYLGKFKLTNCHSRSVLLSNLSPVRKLLLFRTNLLSTLLAKVRVTFVVPYSCSKPVMCRSAMVLPKISLFRKPTGNSIFVNLLRK
jgi:replication factor C subunit 3/5